MFTQATCCETEGETTENVSAVTCLSYKICIVIFTASVSSCKNSVAGCICFHEVIIITACSEIAHVTSENISAISSLLNGCCCCVAGSIVGSVCFGPLKNSIGIGFKEECMLTC